MSYKNTFPQYEEFVNITHPAEIKNKKTREKIKSFASRRRNSKRGITRQPQDCDAGSSTPIPETEDDVPASGEGEASSGAVDDDFLAFKPTISKRVAVASSILRAETSCRLTTRRAAARQRSSAAPDRQKGSESLATSEASYELDQEDTVQIDSSPDATSISLVMPYLQSYPGASRKRLHGLVDYCSSTDSNLLKKC
jgi:hypothetical protein